MLAELPWTAMCCYDRRRLPPDALRDIAAVHPIDCREREMTVRRAPPIAERIADVFGLDLY
jgi:hypothetical protein